MNIEEIGLTNEAVKTLQALATSQMSNVGRVARLLLHEKFPKGIHNAKLEQITRNAKGPITVDDRDTVPFVEVETRVEMSRSQIDDPGLSALSGGIEDAARLHAIAVDTLLINGQSKPNNASNDCGIPIPPACGVKFGCKHGGLIGGGRHLVHRIKGGRPTAEELIAGIMGGRKALRANGHEPPFTLILSPDLYEDAVRPTISLQLPITTIKELLKMNLEAANTEDDIVESPAMPNLHALLFRRPEVDVACSYDGDLQLLSIGSRIAFRLLGEFALRIRNGTAIVVIEYKK